MTVKEAINEVVTELPEQRLVELLEFARYLTWREEQEAWDCFGEEQFAQVYAPDEPEYTEADLKPELNS